MTTARERAERIALRLHQDDCIHTKSDALRDQIDKANCRECLTTAIEAACAAEREAAQARLERVREYAKARNDPADPDWTSAILALLDAPPEPARPVGGERP